MYWCDVIQDEAFTGVHHSVLSGIGEKQMNMKALLLLRLHWDLRDNCPIISGQMRHFAPDFIAFAIHYSSLTSRNETTTGRENEQTVLSYPAKESKGRDRGGREEMAGPAA